MAQQLELKIDLAALNQLGINLYSNVPAVLSELIANAWDADARRVKITTNNNQLIIDDNGCGMNFQDLKDKFLTVGYEQRIDQSGDKTPKLKRQVMGRKGIGKLSVFSIANKVEVHTKKDGETIRFEMDVNALKKKIRSREPYFPELISEMNDYQITEDSGTIIILKDIKKRISNLEKNLKKRISRRFDIWDDNDFSVYVNNDKVTIENRDYFHLLEYAVTYGDYPKKRFKKISSSTNRLVSRENVIDGEDKLSLKGWLGLAKKSSDLGSDKDDNINKISILCRGKVACENILDTFREGGLYTKYLIGEIRADFLDSSDKEDISLANRQGYIEDDPRFKQLMTFFVRVNSNL